MSPCSVQNATAEAARKGVGNRAKFHVMGAEATESGDECVDLALVPGVLHHLHAEKACREPALILTLVSRLC